MYDLNPAILSRSKTTSLVNMKWCEIYEEFPYLYLWHKLKSSKWSKWHYLCGICQFSKIKVNTYTPCCQIWPLKPRISKIHCNTYLHNLLIFICNVLNTTTGLSSICWWLLVQEQGKIATKNSRSKPSLNGITMVRRAACQIWYIIRYTSKEESTKGIKLPSASKHLVSLVKDGRTTSVSNFQRLIFVGQPDVSSATNLNVVVSRFTQHLLINALQATTSTCTLRGPIYLKKRLNLDLLCTTLLKHNHIKPLLISAHNQDKKYFIGQPVLCHESTQGT